LAALVRSRLRGPVLVLALATAASLWLPAAAGADTKPSFTYGPVVAGDPFVGSTLIAAATWSGDPPPTVKYSWGRCPPASNTCTVIKDATNVQYTVTAGDLGYRLAVAVELKNKAATVTATSPATAVITAPPAPAPPPPPPPPQDPAPAEPPPLVTNAATQVSAPSIVKPTPVLLRPFPVVRIRGYFAAHGSRITLLSVRAPRSARISVRCVGRGCPVPALSLAAAPARLRPFERFLPAGTRLQIRVARPGRIGKYASFLIRARRPPLRTDRCLAPSGSRPMRCPAA
jgi:hypothetical protein